MGSFIFPFGQEVQRVSQTDKSPKKAFVLGDTAGAVYACIIDTNEKPMVYDLAVANEPEPFWMGDGYTELTAGIPLPADYGKIIPPPVKNYNGAIGKLLTELVLTPLGLRRNDVWACYVLPEFRCSGRQQRAIAAAYNSSYVKKFNLPATNIPRFYDEELDNAVRREAIADELEASGADTIIVLGEHPMYWFMRFHNFKFYNLSQFGHESHEYGRTHEIKIRKTTYQFIPLAHPRLLNPAAAQNHQWIQPHAKWVRRHTAAKG